MKSPILGATYVAKSINAANNRMVNLQIEPTEDGGKEAAYLSRTPGLRLLATVGTGPIRGAYQFGSYGYVVSGDSLYRVDNRWGSTFLGFVNGTGPVSMADNGTQLFIACNNNGFIYNSSSQVFQQITDPDFPGAVTVGYLDGYFVFNKPNSQEVWITSLLDGTSVDPLDFASAEGSPDKLVAVKVDHLEVWLFGTRSIEVWYDAGSPDFPLARVQGAFIEIGCAAPYSIVKLDNSLFWLGSDERGFGVVYRTAGYQGQRVSTYAVEWKLQSYGDLTNAVAYSYQQNGHAFYVLTIPGTDTTWVYDVSTGLWHERCSFSNGSFDRHWSNCQMNFNNTIVVGDYRNGNLYAYDTDVYDDNGSVQKWLRSWRALPSGENNLKRSAHHSLQIDCEAGVGLTTGQGSDPQMILRWSDDGGHFFSNEHWRSVGKIGETGQRVIWRRLGGTEKLRDRVYELSGTDPVKINIMGAELIMSGTNA